MPRETDVLVRKVTGGAMAHTGAESATDDSALALFGDWRDQRLIDAFGVTISTLRRQLRAEFAEELAERDPQLKKIAALELELAKLSGAVDVLRAKEPPPPSKFPAVKVFKEGSISYAGDIVTHEGNTWQARRDTAQAPGLSDWTCIARAGRDGESLTVRGTYDPADSYAFLDVVL